MSDRSIAHKKARLDLCFGRLIRTICCPAARHMSGSTFQTYVRPLHRTQKSPVGPLFRKADPDHMLSSGTTYVRIYLPDICPTAPSHTKKPGWTSVSEG